MSVFHVGWNTLGSEHIGRLRVLDATAEGLEADLAAARGRARGAASVRLQAAFPDFDFVAIARRSGTADPRTVERERLRVETEAQITPAERRSIAARVWDVIARVLGLGS